MAARRERGEADAWHDVSPAGLPCASTLLPAGRVFNLWFHSMQANPTGPLIPCGYTDTFFAYSLPQRMHSQILCIASNVAEQYAGGKRWQLHKIVSIKQGL